MTVHKSQGSEFNHVVLALPDSSNLVLTPKLIYTAITRAKKNFTLLENSAGMFRASIIN
jgi:exodeoxyribonuclease V alpha subunit